MLQTTKKSDKRNTFTVDKGAKVFLDGTPAKIEDLKESFAVKVAIGEEHVITKIEAPSKAK